MAKAKGFRLTQALKGREAMLRRLVCEVRFADGQLFLDRCGRILKSFVSGTDDWMAMPNPAPNGAALVHMGSSIRLGFSQASAHLLLDRTTGSPITQDEAAAFAALAADDLPRVLDELEVAEFIRLGYREVYEFAFDTKEESEAWASSLALASAAPGLSAALGAKVESFGFAAVLQGEECRYRVALNGIERAAEMALGDATLSIRLDGVSKKHRSPLVAAMKRKKEEQLRSPFAAALDLDAFLVDPGEADPGAFVKEQSGAAFGLLLKSIDGPARKG